MHILSSRDMKMDNTLFPPLQNLSLLRRQAVNIDFSEYTSKCYCEGHHTQIELNLVMAEIFEKGTLFLIFFILGTKILILTFRKYPHISYIYMKQYWGVFICNSEISEVDKRIY